MKYSKGAFGTRTGQDRMGQDGTGRDRTYCSVLCLECLGRLGQNSGLYCYTFGMAGTGRDKGFK